MGGTGDDVLGQCLGKGSLSQGMAIARAELKKEKDAPAAKAGARAAPTRRGSTTGSGATGTPARRASATSRTSSVSRPSSSGSARPASPARAGGAAKPKHIAPGLAKPKRPPKEFHERENQEIAQFAATLGKTFAQSSFMMDKASLRSMMHDGDAELSWKELELGAVLGEGRFAVVHKAKWKKKAVVVKQYKRTGGTEGSEITKEEELEIFKKEVALMRRLDSPHVVKIIGYAFNPAWSIVTDFCSGGTVDEYLRKPELMPMMDLQTTAHFALQAAKGMEYLHGLSPPVIHRDLRSANLFVHKDNGKHVVKIGDFNLSKNKEDSTMIMTECGTFQWIAPEIVKEEPASEKVDVYSFALVLWELVTRKVPFEDHESGPMFASLQAAFYGLRPELDDVIYPEFVPLIEECWKEDPNERPAFPSIVKKLRGVWKRAGAVAEDGEEDKDDKGK